MELRVIGQQVTVRLTRDNELLNEITAIKDFNFEMRTRILSEGYLGETANRQDEIFEEVGGSFTVHPEGTDVLDLQRKIFERASRRIAGATVISATFRTVFPDGSVARITIPDMKFDPIPFNPGARDGYVSMTFTYKASSYILSI